jgi:ribosomal protein S18 acetylase RimI-like enzyme
MSSTRADVVIRSVAPAELASWLELVNRARYWQDDLEALRFDDTLRPAEEPVLRLGAWTPDGALVGVAEARLSEDGSRYEDRVAGLVGVAPTHRRQGLGTRLAEEVEGFAVSNGVRWVEAEVREGNLPASLPFVQGRGYVELERYRTSVQNPSAVDLTGLDPLRSRLEGEAIEIVAFPAIDSARARDELYRATLPIWRDMPHEPHVDWEDPTPEIFARSIFERPSVLLDGFIVARDGERIVGLSYLMRRPDGDAEVGDTGVLRDYRRRGIARAMKMMVTRYAAERGLARVHTDNRADNAGMLAINRELGFVPSEQIVIFEKTLRHRR